MTSTVVVSSRLGHLQEVVAGLEGAGCEVVLTPEPPPGKQLLFTPSRIAAYFRRADGFIGSPGERYSREVLEAGERLTIGCSYVIGTENIDVEADHSLRNHPRAIATGHNIGHSEECYAALAVAAVENTLRGLRGEEPLYLRNPRVLPAWRERLDRLTAPVVNA